ncbi:MAG: carbohydrate ABC transporter permease [Vampirovibrionales bacterium]|nr:carbohydrate ABC transporter permease [Vampirovibrionales bacterium]
MSTRPQFTLTKTLRWTLIGALAVASLLPFGWLVLTSLQPSDANIFDPTSALALLQGHTQPTLEHYTAVWQNLPMAAYLFNSVGSTLVAIGLNLILSLMAAYPLARGTFKGKGAMMALVLATMFIPFQVIMIPLLLQANALGLTDASGGSEAWWTPLKLWLGLAIPFAISGFGIFFLRQALMALPRELDDAACLDGCTPWQTLWFVLTPLLRPSLATLAIFTLMASWGEFLWPSLTLVYDNHLTLPVGLVYLQGAFSNNWRLIAAGTVMSMIPSLLVFLLLQRQFMAGMTSGAVKG